jgi:hypothetical protein
MKTLKEFTINGMTYKMVKEQNKIVCKRDYTLEPSEYVEPITRAQLAYDTRISEVSHGQN